MVRSSAVFVFWHIIRVEVPKIRQISQNIRKETGESTGQDKTGHSPGQDDGCSIDCRQMSDKFAICVQEMLHICAIYVRPTFDRPLR